MRSHVIGRASDRDHFKNARKIVGGYRTYNPRVLLCDEQLTSHLTQDHESSDEKVSSDYAAQAVHDPRVQALASSEAVAPTRTHKNTMYWTSRWHFFSDDPAKRQVKGDATRHSAVLTLLTRTGEAMRLGFSRVAMPAAHAVARVSY